MTNHERLPAVVGTIELDEADLKINDRRQDSQATEGIKAVNIDIETDGRIVFYYVVYEDGSRGLERLVKDVDPEDQDGLALASAILKKKHKINP